MRPHLSKFEKKSPIVWVAFAKKLVRQYGTSRVFLASEAVRVIREGKGYRIDKAPSIAGAWMPWEPITSIEYRTASAAKRAIKKYVEAEAE